MQRATGWGFAVNLGRDPLGAQLPHTGARADQAPGPGGKAQQPPPAP